MKNTKEIYNQVSQGSNPVVRFTACVADSDSQYEVGMLGNIISASTDSNEIVWFVISEAGFREFNIKQELPIWYKSPDSDEQVCKRELGGRKMQDKVPEDMDDDVCNFEIVESENNKLFEEFLSTDTETSYVSWLEDKIINSGQKRDNYDQVRKEMKRDGICESDIKMAVDMMKHLRNETE